MSNTQTASKDMDLDLEDMDWDEEDFELPDIRDDEARHELIAAYAYMGLAKYTCLDTGKPLPFPTDKPEEEARFEAVKEYLDALFLDYEMGINLSMTGTGLVAALNDVREFVREDFLSAYAHDNEAEEILNRPMDADLMKDCMFALFEEAKYLTEDSDDLDEDDDFGHHHHHHDGPCNHDHHHHGELLTPIVREVPKIGRNDPCLCGSGKKYKKCCMG